jgi:hypothetical protein
MHSALRFCPRVLIAGAVALTAFAPLPALAASSAVLAPEISISPRGAANRTIEVGEPLFVAVRIERPEEGSAGIELAPATGNWSDAVEVGITGADGSALRLRAQAALRDESVSAIFDAERIAGGVWFVASSATAQLPPGEYFVKARLVIREGKGWMGEVASEPVALRVVAAASNGVDHVQQRTIALAQEAMVANAPQEAARLLDARLAEQPDNIRLLTARAALCMRGGDYRSAMICVNRAMNRVALEKRPHPPADLFELENQIAIAEAASPLKAVLPEWTRLPASVLAPIREESGPPANPAKTLAVSAISAAPVQSSSRTVNSAPAASTTGTVKPSPPSAVSAGPGSVISFAELADAKIIVDPAGQWAASAVAGSQYGKTQYSAAQATGAPNISVQGNSPDAWCPANKTKGTDWLEVTFAAPTRATEVRVRQNDTPGAITKIEAIEGDGTVHVWWEGVDPFTPPAVREIVWFAVRVPKTDYLVSRIKITLNLAAMPGWKQIDAVQLVRAKD